MTPPLGLDNRQAWRMWMFAAAFILVVLAESPAHPPVVGREAPLTTVRPSFSSVVAELSTSTPSSTIRCSFSYRSGIRITRRVQHDKASSSLSPRVTYLQTTSNSTSIPGTCTLLHGPGTQPSANSTKRLPSSRSCASLSFTTGLPTITHQPSNEQPPKLSPNNFNNHEQMRPENHVRSTTPSTSS